MGVIMDGEAQPSQIAGAARWRWRSRASGRRRWSASRRRCAQRAAPLPRAGRRRCSTRAAPAATARTRSTSRRPRRSSRGRGRARRQARQPRGVEPVRQRGRVRGARRRTSMAPPDARGRGARRGEPRVLLRAGVASVDAARGPDAPRAGRAHGVQPARPADESGAARARQLVGVSRPEHTELLARALGAARRGARVGRARRGRPRRDLDARATRRSRSCARGTVNTFYVHPADVGPAGRVGRAICAGGTAAENAAMIERLLDGEPGPRRDIVLLNAGAALLVAGVASSLARRRRARPRSIDRGGARQARARRAAGGLSDDDAATCCTTVVAAARRSRRRARARDARDARRARGRGAAPRGDAFARALARAGHPRSSPSASAGRRRAASCGATTIRRRSRAGTRRAGAAAISVLTEPTFFDGSLDHLRAVRAAVDVPSCARTSSSTEFQIARGGGRRRRRRAADRRRARRRGRCERCSRVRARMELAALVEVHDRRRAAIARSTPARRSSA